VNPTARHDAGAGHHFLVIVYLFRVLALLFHIPFGKLFHMFQLLCSLCVALYKHEGEEGPRAHCSRCGEHFTSAMHVADLKGVLDQLGFTTPTGEVHYQDISPACRRRLVALNQGSAIGRQIFTALTVDQTKLTLETMFNAYLKHRPASESFQAFTNGPDADALQGMFSIDE
jgi:hypothetical protein